jgi:mRNA-degrading endonuclease RelE of RelBE toxin-antitoxin system
VKFRIEYSPESESHLGALAIRDRAIVVDSVERVLGQLADLPARNRKLLRANWLAPWELRIGELRVFYDIDYAVEAEPVVLVRAVGKKVRNELYIAGKQVDLDL